MWSTGREPCRGAWGAIAAGVGGIRWCISFRAWLFLAWKFWGAALGSRSSRGTRKKSLLLSLLSSDASYLCLWGSCPPFPEVKMSSVGQTLFGMKCWVQSVSAFLSAPAVSPSDPPKYHFLCRGTGFTGWGRMKDREVILLHLPIPRGQMCLGKGGSPTLKEETCQQWEHAKTN